MHRISRGVLVLAATALLGAACGGGGPAGTSTTEKTPTVTSPAPETLDPAVPESLMFQARTVDGGQFDAAALAGKPVALWFWAAWCPHCAHQARDVKAIQSEYVDKAHVLGVAGLGSGEDSMRDFVSEHELDGFPNLADDDGEVWRRFGVTTMEYYVVLDASGVVAHEGHFDAQALRDQLSALVD
jgi:peroxiredoxin